jgi:hypothetical protein
MKNLFLLPTDKPSRLYLFEERLILGDLVTVVFKNSGAVNQNIYITSDEDIKDVRPHKGKWQLEKGQILNQFPDYLTDLSECKLVIMTTDPQLIADGVQAIDDEFLEWFVKNPSCEFIRVGLEIWNDGNHNPIIIIPKEEPKQGSMSEAIKKVINDKLQEEPKQETLEETKEELFRYSEREVLEILENYDREFKLDTFAYTNTCSFTVKEWFEQNKKK